MRILQVTDSHLIADKTQFYRDINTYQQLQNALTYIRAHEQWDAMIFTGDNSQDGSPESYQHLAQLTHSFTAPLYAIPGNHDDIAVMASALPHVNQGKVHRLGNWNLMLLNSQVVGEPHGYLGDKELAQLANQLNQNTRPTLVAVHHQPMPVGTGWMDQIKLQNGDALLELLAHYPQVKGLIFGHVHQAFESHYQHIRVMGTPSCSHQFKPHVDAFAMDDTAPGYRWLELNADGTLDSGVIRMTHANA